MKIKLNQFNLINIKIFESMGRCVLPMNVLGIVIFISLIFSSCKKNTTNQRTVSGNIKIIQNLKYGTNKNLQGDQVDLYLDIYMPANATASQKLPFILFVHGGGFVAGDKSSAADALKKFVSEGYVAASINYRLDESLEDAIDPCSVDTIFAKKAVYIAVQDARAAMRFISANAETYHVDTNRVFLNGNSAGAITVLNSYFLNQSDFNTIIPDVELELGNINLADNNYTNGFKIIGIAANSGCLSDPRFITSFNAIPVIFFHGGIDSVIPIDRGRTYYCPQTLYVFGSRMLYKRMADLGQPSVLHVDPQGSHGSYDEDFLVNNEICFFNSVLNSTTESGSYTGQQSSCH